MITISMQSRRIVSVERECVSFAATEIEEFFLFAIVQSNRNKFRLLSFIDRMVMKKNFFFFERTNYIGLFLYRDCGAMRFLTHVQEKFWTRVQREFPSFVKASIVVKFVGKVAAIAVDSFDTS